MGCISVHVKPNTKFSQCKSLQLKLTATVFLADLGLGMHVAYSVYQSTIF